ncbi:MAG: hypothetical protein K6B41_14330 [Butyrivibrio sp.]|nr:hypothetical protein [Butyrivibrio sp.]
MRMKEKFFTKFLIGFSALFLGAVISTPQTAKAQVVTPDEGSAGIYEAFENDGVAELQSGETYYLPRLTIESNQTIIATGATIYTSGPSVKHFPNSGNYDSAVNIKIIGGNWLSTSSGSGGRAFSAFQFAHCNGITLKDMYINNTPANSHAIEIIGCKNVTIDGCTVKAIGSPSSSTSVEEGIQFDIATHATAPNVFYTSSNSLANGHTCQNVKINNCKVSGFGRGICANFTETESRKWVSNYHKNFTVTNCEISSKTAEALALLNVVGIKVNNNKLTSTAKKSRYYYASGLHIASYGKNKSGLSSAKYIVSKNTIKGTNYAIHVDCDGKGKINKLTIKNNILTSKTNKDNPIRTLAVKKVVDKNNTITGK